MLSIASHNGLAATQRTFSALKEGKDLLDAILEGIERIEDDPEELTVGYGGLPNEAGVVELDAAIMDGRTHRGAGVAALQKVRHPTRVARALMQQTGRVLVVGDGALQFARANGFLEENLLTEKARRMWLYWKRSQATGDDWQPPATDADLELQAWFDRHFYATPGGPAAGTVHVSGIDSAGNLACATSTSGHAFKLPGRVGDSPILGAGLYADNEVGTCGSIGHGEANLQNLSSFAAVELMRQGMDPQAAGLEALRRIVRKASPKQLDADGRPRFNVQLYLLTKDGRHAGCAMWGPKNYAVSDAQGDRLEKCAALYEQAK